MNNRIQLLENRERNTIERIEQLEKRLDEKDEQIANIQEAYQHIVNNMLTVPLVGGAVSFEVKE